MKHDGAMTVEKCICLVNLAASLLWIGGTVWFQPELQFNPLYLTYNGCNMFIIGFAVFIVTTSFSLYGAHRAHAPQVVIAGHRH